MAKMVFTVSSDIALYCFGVNIASLEGDFAVLRLFKVLQGSSRFFRVALLSILQYM